MAPEELRLECLKLVLQVPIRAASCWILASSFRARAHADFVINQSGRGDSVNGTPVLTMALGKDCETPQ
jgi:hypothetical protein